MCRLFGFRSNLPSKVHRSLVAERNSLRAQSDEHKDGWGIAYYRQVMPEIALGLLPAHGDPEFERISNLVCSHAVLAHVRLASVGAVHLRNAHPFLHERWAFAHNGTIREFVKHQSEIEALIDPSLRSLIKGETDSERCFHVFLTQLGDAQRSTVEQVAAALARTIRLISSIADRPGAGRCGSGNKPCSMTFLVTDGQLMVATRHHRTLFFSEGKKRDHTPHLEPAPGTRFDQLVIASEKVSDEDHWHEVPEDGVVGVEPDLTFHRWTVGDLAGDDRGVGRTMAARWR